MSWRQKERLKGCVQEPSPTAAAMVAAGKEDAARGWREVGRWLGQVRGRCAENPSPTTMRNDEAGRGGREAGRGQ